VKSSIALIVQVWVDVLYACRQGRQILAQNLIYFMNFVDFYHVQAVA